MYNDTRNRFFSTIANAQHWGPQGSYAFSPNVILTGSNGLVQSGAWIPLLTDTNGALQVSLNGATLSGSFSVDNTSLIAAITTGNSYSSGILNTLQTGVAVTITNSAPLAVSGNLVSSVPVWNKISSTGYVSGFSPFVGPVTIKGIQGYSKSSVNNGYSFLQIYDSVGTAAGPLVSTLAITSGNGLFLDYAENGTTFQSGLTIINSSDPVVNQQYNTADFFITILYR